MMKIVFLMSSLVGAFGADCAEGYKHKAALVAADICNTKETLKDNCDKCCEKDVTKCGGQAVTTCDAGFYWGAAGDKVTTTATSKVDCCVAQATCAQSEAQCNNHPGYKYKTSAKDTKCATHMAESCTLSCCEKDVLKCGGLTVSCVSPKVPNNGGRRRERKATADAWKNKATTEANKLTDCCQAKATCAIAGYTCQPGFVKDPAKTANECSGQTSSYADLTSQTSCAYTCCKADVTKCAAYVGTAGCDAATHYEGEAATKAATAGTKKVDCCTLKAKCAAGTCASDHAALKMKASVATTNCATDAASCAGTNNGGVLTCCEPDVLKCGGLNVVCPAASSYNECPGGINQKFANQAAYDAFMAARRICLNKATTEANKNKLTSAGGCCTAKGTCAAFKLAVAPQGQASKTAAQLLPGAFLIVVLSALGAF